MSISLLCPEAQAMAVSRGIPLSSEAIRQLASLEDYRQTGYLHSPLLQNIIDRTMFGMLAGSCGGAPAPSPVATPQPVHVAPAPSEADPDDDPEIPDVFNLFD